MSLITRGFGVNSALVVQGFGPPPSSAPPVSGSQKVFWPGRRSKLYDHLAESLYVRNYAVSAQILSINGVSLDHIKPSRVEGKIDEREAYKVLLDENVYVQKTNPENSIFINILSFFKR